jgi:hypothetical protein
MLPSMKLVDLVEHHGEEIAEQWAKIVIKHPFTPYYHKMPTDDLIPRAMKFYRNFRSIFTEQKPIEAAENFFTKYAEERYNEGVPLHEGIYALILMRRQLWLYAEFQAVFTSAMEKHQAMESLNRTILVFDYATYYIAKKYDDLMKKAACKA